MNFVRSFFAKGNRKQLITVATMLINVGLGVADIVLSIVKLSLFIGFSGIYNIVLAIAKYSALSNIHQLNGSDKAQKAQIEKRGINRINICTLIASLLFFCFGIVIAFYYEDSSNYGIGMIYFIAGNTAYKILSFIIGIIVNRKKRTGVQFYLKQMRAAVVLISLALTQRAIFYYLAIDNAKLMSGIGAIIFSFFALCIAVFMRIREKGTLKKPINN